jgi:hypothetical protein
MSVERDTTRIVRSWLRTDEHESADRILDAVLDALDTTPQRRSLWLPRRFSDMNNYARLAIAAAAVVVVAFVAINLLPRSGSIGGPGPIASPSPTIAATAVPTPSPTAAAVFPPAGPLSIGSHSVTLEGVPFSFTVPTADWVSNGTFGIDKAPVVIGPEGAGFIFWNDAPVGAFSNPCAGTKGPQVGPSIADLAAAVAAVPGTDLVSGPTDVTVGGKPAKKVVITVPEDIGCAAQSFFLWYAPGPDQQRYATAVGSTISTWIIEVDGSIVWIDGETFKGASPARAQEIEAIVNSIQFE